MPSKLSIFIILFISFFGNSVWGNEIYHIPPYPPTIGDPVSFETTISSNNEVTEAIFLYRMYGQQSYNEIEMKFMRNMWTATISQVPEGDGIEYFFIFRQQDGSEMVLPEGDPSQYPYILSISQLPASKSNINNSEAYQQEENAFLILTPDANDIVYSDDVLFMVSLFNIPEIDISSIHLYLDDQDITTDALVTPDIVTYAPAKVEPGIKMLTITASNNNGDIISPMHHTISVISSNKTTSWWNNFSYSANGKSAVFMDQVAMEQGDDAKLNIYQTDLFLNGGWPKLQFKSRFKITSEESQFKQPKNRYFATVESGRFIKISLGDFTPSMSPYTIQGKRLRGIGTEWRYKWLQFKTAHGELDRAIQGVNNTDQSYKVEENVSVSNNTVIYRLDRRGYTFKNDMSSYRLALNFDDRIIFGSTLLKTKADIKSVVRELPDASFTVSPDDDIDPSFAQLDPGTYTFSQFHNTVSEDPLFDYELSDKGWSGNKPQQNLVLGTDFRLSLDEQKFLLDGYWAISFLNKDIWDGPMTFAELDTLLGDPEDGQIMGMMDTTNIPNPADFEDWMTINMNLVPIVPIDYNLFESDPWKAFMNMPSTAYNLKFRSLYFNNIFEIQYSQVGPEFTSLANPYFPKNTREFSIIDKIWLLDRRLQSSVNYKFKTNDILETNTNPYNEVTYGINLNYIPGMDMPTAMYGHQSIIRTNPKTEIDTILNSDNTYSLYDLRVYFTTSNHLFTLNVPINRDDVSYWVGGVYNSIVGTDQLAKERPANFLSQASSMQFLSLVFGARYQTGLKLILNISNFTNNHIVQGKTQLNGASITTSYPLFRDKISLSGTFSYLSSSGLSEFSNYGLSLGSTIKISNAFRISLAASTKARSTSEGTEMSNSAVKLSTNYIF